MTEPVDLARPVADAVRGHWADRLLPLAARPYARLMRLERPIGWWLLLWPCWWSAALAALAAGAALPNLWHMALFLVGAVAMRGAGCVWNDFLDRDIDGRVERTRSRPIPSGQVSPREALVFMVALLGVGLAVLLQFNAFAIAVGFASMLVVPIYPLMKRVTNWPQAVLGLAFSWGALMGWAAWFGALDAPALWLYAAAVAWTVGYDTIYAHQDKDDDAVVGVRSTALLFGRDTRLWLGGFYAVAVGCLAVAVVGAGGGVIALSGVAGFALHLAWQVARLDIDDPDLCLKLFRTNRDAGAIPFLGLVAEAAVRALG